MGNLKYKQTHRAEGLCADCSEPVIFPSIRCDKHRQTHRENESMLKKKRKENNQCPRCGTPLHTEMDKGKIACLTCREHLT